MNSTVYLFEMQAVKYLELKVEKICKYDPQKAKENFILKWLLHTMQIFNLPLNLLREI